MTRFYRRLIRARAKGYGAELAFWADYAERHNYRGADRLRAMADAYPSPAIIPADSSEGRRKPGPMPEIHGASAAVLVEVPLESLRHGSSGSPQTRRPEDDTHFFEKENREAAYA